MVEPECASAAAPAERAHAAYSLSARLLALTFLFVLFAEILIFVPSLAAHHREWLQDRVNSAQIAALAIEAAAGLEIAESLGQELLVNAQVKRVALKRANARELRLDAPLPAGPMPAMRDIDLRGMMTTASIASAFQALFAPEGRFLRILATPRFESGEFIEVVLAEQPLKRELAAYSVRILSASLALSLLAGAVVYVTLNAALVRPMRRLTSHIERFRDRPEDVSRDIAPSRRRDEIGRAETAFAAMEAQVRAAFRQRERLAGLGAAIARLAHDMRNSLATAQLVAERLGASEDPQVRQAALRLERVIQRAGSLAEAASRYGRSDERAPVLQSVPLAEAVEEAAADALAAFPGAQWANRAEPNAQAWADPDHLDRILGNLLRNAAQAGVAAGRPVRIAATARREGAAVIIEIADQGPGVPVALRDSLFQPFSGGGRSGVGLGLAIARELARAMGGDVTLARSSDAGAVFAISLRPPPAV